MKKLIKTACIVLSVIFGLLSFSACAGGDLPPAVIFDGLLRGSFISGTGGGRSYEEEERQKLSEEARNIALQYYYEDDRYAGFLDENYSDNLYGAYSALQLARKAGNEEAVAAVLKEKLAGSFVALNLERLSLLDSYYYADLCEAFGYDLDETHLAVLKEKLNHSRREDFDILYLDSPQEFVGTSLLITAMFHELAPVFGSENLPADHEIERCASSAAFEKYVPQSELLFYSAGGYFIYALNEYGLFDEERKANTAEWFQSWQDYFESMELNSVSAILDYSEYVKIKSLYDGDLSDETVKITMAVKEIPLSEWAEIEDGNLISEALHFVSLSQDDDLTAQLRSYALGYAEQYVLKSGVFSEQNTLAGIYLLSDSKQIDFEKIEAFVTERYIPGNIYNENAVSAVESMLWAAEITYALSAEDFVYNKRKDLSKKFHEMYRLKMESLEGTEKLQYLRLLNALADLYVKVFMPEEGPCFPVDMRKARDFVSGKIEADTLTLEEAFLAERVSVRIENFDGKEEEMWGNVANLYGYNLAQNKIISVSEVFKVYDESIGEDGLPPEGVIPTLREYMLIADFIDGVRYHDTESLQDETSALKTQEMEKRLQIYSDALTSANGLFALYKGGPVTPYSAWIGLRSGR